MGPSTELALKLQAVDSRILELKKEIAALPKHIARIEAQLDSHRRRLEADQAALSANQKERRKREIEIQGLEEKISRLKNQMLEARTNEQYRAFQHEIAFGEGEIRKAEDRILELMEESEPLTEAVAKAEAALQDERVQVEAEKKLARERTTADQQQLEEATRERKRIADALPPALLNLFERIRKKRGYPVLTEETGGRCGACNIALRPQFLQDLRQAGEPMVCESCGRLLYHHPLIGVEAEQSSAPLPSQ